MGLVMSNTIMLAFTSDYKILSTTYSSSSVTVLGISISEPLVVSFIITVAITAALYWFLYRTDTGQAIRATAQDREAAQLMGINVKRMSIIAFGMGTALAGNGRRAHLAHLLYLSPGGKRLHAQGIRHHRAGRHGQHRRRDARRRAHRRCRIGGRRLLGSGWKDVIVFVLFLLVLLFRPSGLLGTSKD